MVVLGLTFGIVLLVIVVLAIHSLVMADLKDRGKSLEWREYLKKGGEDV